MNKYLGDLSFDDVELFLAFNNREERNNRHIDYYCVDDPNLSEEEVEKFMKYNKKKLIDATRSQILNGVIKLPEKYR